MYIAKVGRRGQITLPSAIRRLIGIQEGDQIAFLPEGNQIIIYPVIGTLPELRGSIPVDGEQDFSTIRQKVIKARSSRQDNPHA